MVCTNNMSGYKYFAPNDGLTRLKMLFRSKTAIQNF